MGVIDESYAHRLRNVGNPYYQYDSNGNIICEQEGSFDENSDPYIPVVKTEGEDVYSSDYGWGLFKESSKGAPTGEAGYRRVYTWNERNQLISSVDSLYNTAYVYGQDGQRSNKYTDFSETLYFNSMWTHHTDTGNSIYGGQTAKNIYLGETRIVTKLNSGNDPTSQEEYYKQYYYHSDHLGSAQLITDYKGDEYQRIEYTPYGETWVEKTSNTGSEFLPYKFTGKELDPETGLYYYGARYLDPKYSIWLSADPALGEYIPGAPVNDEAKKRNSNLPGMGGVFNTVNLHLYHYAGIEQRSFELNNPVKYVDPDGRADEVSSTFKLPKGFWDQFTKDNMKEFWAEGFEGGDSTSTSCSSFLPSLTKKLSDKVYKDVFPNGDESASKLYSTFINNQNLEELAPNGSAEDRASMAQSLANDGYLVVAALEGGNHVAAIGPQSLKYGSHPTIPWKGHVASFQSGNGYGGEILRQYPVFVQAGDYTGVVNPGNAMGRSAFNNNKVHYFIYAPKN